MWYVYILKSDNINWYYVGNTNNINRRISEHNSKKVKSTKGHAPLKLVWIKLFNNEKDCRSYEKIIKGKRKEKERILREEININCQIV